MANFAECILIKISPCDPGFLSMSTFDIFHGRSGRFLLRKRDMADLLNATRTYLLDTDISSYVQITRTREKLLFRLTWLRHDFRNDVNGYVHCFELPVNKLREVMAGRKVHHVEYVSDVKPKAKLDFSSESHALLKEYCKDKLTKHALKRFFRDHFNYGADEQLAIFPDRWVKGFYFQCDSLSGGIVRHEDVVTGKDGREYKKIFYAVHT